MKTKTVQTYEAKIYVGIYPSAEDGNSEPIFLPASYRDCERAPHPRVMELCQKYADSEKVCVTVSPTTFVYPGGSEPGCVIGMINYPRFPATKAKVRRQAAELASILIKALEQRRASIVFSDRTVMLENEERIGEGK